MKKQRTSIDGFKPRRPSDKLGNINNNSTFSMSERNILLGDRNNENKKYLTLEKQQTRRTIGRSDIDESLHDIDKAIVPIKKLSRKQRQHIKKMSKKPRSRARRIVRRIVITLIIAVLAFLGYAAIKFIITGNNIFQGNMFDIFQNQPLKQDSRGRSNFLILGTSEDNIGHNGADLTDSMLIISVDQKKKNVYMFSVPRDLYVDYG